MLQLLLQHTCNSHLAYTSHKCSQLLLCLSKNGRIQHVIGNVTRKYYAVVWKVNTSGPTLVRTFKKCFAMYVVVPISRNFLGQILFYIFCEGRSELAVVRAVSIERFSWILQKHQCLFEDIVYPLYLD